MMFKFGAVFGGNIFAFLFILAMPLRVFAEKKQMVEIPLPVIKIPSRVQSLDWNSTGAYFSHTEGNTIIVRDGKDYSKKYDVGINGGKITDVRFVSNFEGKLEQILMFSENSELSVFKFPNTTPTKIERMESSFPPPVAEFSTDGNFIAIGRKDGDVDLFFQLYLTQNVTRSRLRNPLEAHFKSEPCGLAFSTDSKYLASLQQNGKIIVWSIEERKPLVQLHGVVFGKPCFVFYKDNLVIARDEQTVQIVNFNGDEVLKFKIAGKIASFSVSKDEENLIVLTTENQFQYYSLETGENKGFIPAWNKSPVSCYSFTRDGTRLLVGHDDGSVYVLEIDKVYFPKGTKPGVFKMFDVDSGETWRYDADKMVVLGEDDEIIRKTAHNIEARASYKISTSKYYTHGFDVQIGYLNDRLVKKFYFGGMLDFSLFMPNKKYPYKYSINGMEIKEDPYMLVFDAAAVAGKFWQPIQDYSDFTVFAEVELAAGTRFIENRVLGIGNMNLGFFGGINGGVRWKGLTVYVIGGFDTVMDGVFGAGIGYRFRITPKVRVTGKEKE